MLIYLIDGNNVIRAHPEWERIFREDPGNAKNLIIQKIVNHFKDTRNEVTIFFDGFDFIHSFSKISNNVSIKHAKNKTADETILVTIEKSKNKKNLVIVSNDSELSTKARLHQCRVITSNEFIRSIQSKITSKSDKPVDMLKSEIEYWLKLFQSSENENK